MIFSIIYGMGKNKKGSNLSRSDRNHLRDFGELHPADLESKQRKTQRKELIETGAYKVIY